MASAFCGRERDSFSEPRVRSALRRLAESTSALWAPQRVPRRPMASITAIEFLRDFVAASQPLVLTELPAEDWPCLQRWSDEYLLAAAGEAEVSVNLTPQGHGDFVDSHGWFVKPLEERMPFRSFLERLQGSGTPSGEVPYLSQQNDSFRQEFPCLTEDVPAVSPLGAAVFGNDPEAVNLWIGDERSVSSCHKDHYENLYIVVRGEKVFTLLPPAAVPEERRCPPASFVRTGAGLTAELEDGERVPWVVADIEGLEVRVGPGEMLYLPAMWYHRVAQRGVTIAVNYWHDMSFGHHYIHHEFLRGVVGLDDEELLEGAQ